MLNRNKSEVTIRVEKLGKKFLVPQKHDEGVGLESPTLRTRLKEFFPELLGATDRDYFWALRDVSFEVRRGEILGIVGENGSGKSTLLKILSGVTPPSEGRAEMTGRIGSLLEVGTGFHPDLTGRENIFFNGALLGLSTEQIREKLGQIIEFSGIEDFIDVPVKRYSSGMYVRLAFSVASLLESDILILDEVLAVGDEGFRNKSKTNMRDRAEDGSTVLFVSHNMNQVRDICDRCVILEHGRIVFSGTPKEATARYWRQQMGIPEKIERKENEEDDGNEEANELNDLDVDLLKIKRYSSGGTRHLSRLEVFDPDNPGAEVFRTGGRIGARVHLKETEKLEGRRLSVGLHFHTELVFAAASVNNLQRTGFELRPGTTVAECILEDIRLGSGDYSIAVDLSYYEAGKEQFTYVDSVGHATFITVKDEGYLNQIPAHQNDGAAHITTWTFK